jgi:hypothetical protein
LVGSAVMPIGVLEMNPAIPHAALSTTPLSGGFAGYLLLRNSLAEPLFWLLRKLFHGELPQIGSPRFMGLMIPQAGTHLNYSERRLLRRHIESRGTDGTFSDTLSATVRLSFIVAESVPHPVTQRASAR